MKGVYGTLEIARAKYTHEKAADSAASGAARRTSPAKAPTRASAPPGEFFGELPAEFSEP